MALNSFVGRASSFITPLTAQHFTQRSAVSVLPSVGFSTDVADNNNLGSLIETEPAPDHEAITIKEYSPFVLDDRDEMEDIWLRSWYQGDRINVKVGHPKVSKHGSLVFPMEKQYMTFDICASRSESN